MNNDNNSMMSKLKGEAQEQQTLVCISRSVGDRVFNVAEM